MQRRYAILVALVAILAASSIFPMGGTLLSSWAVLGWGRWLYNLPGSGKFVQVATDVYRLDLWWRPLPLMLIPLTSVLVHDPSSDRWALIDAGAANSWSQSYASTLVAALKRTLPKKAGLDAILLTHAHFDHVGALPQLLAAYPSAQVMIHEAEAPFLAGSASYYPLNSPVVSLAQTFGLAPRSQPKVDQSKLQLLRGSSGSSLSSQGLPSLSWIPSPGHSPGHVSYLHSPSKILILGDALLNVWPSAGMEGWLGSLLAWPLKKFGRGGVAAVTATGGGLLRLLPRFATDALPSGLQQALTTVLLGAGGSGRGPGGQAAHEHVVSGGLSVVGGAGDETSGGTVVKGGRVEGQPAGEVKVPYTWGLPKVAFRIKPMFICPRPTGDEQQGHKSICRLASLEFKRAVPMHDFTGRGLSPRELADFAASLPSCS